MSTDGMKGTVDGTGLRGDIVISGGANVSYAGKSILGGEGAYLTLSAGGEAVSNFADSTLTLTKGAATVNGDGNGHLKALLIATDDPSVPLKIKAESGTSVSIPASKVLSIPNDGSLVIDGNLDVAGTLELHSTATFGGKADVTGNVYVLDDGANQSTTLNDGTTFNVSGTGAVYSNFEEVGDSVVGGNIEQGSEGYTYSPISATPSGTAITLKYKWALAAPVTPAAPQLTNLTISNGTLSPAFSAGQHSYTASVGNSVSSITVTPTVDDGSIVTVNGKAVISGHASGAIALSVGSNTITIEVSSGEQTRTYTIIVTRASSTGGGGSSGGGGGGSSSSGYTVSVDSGIENGDISVSPSRAERGDTVTITVDPDEGYELDTLVVTDNRGKPHCG